MEGVKTMNEAILLDESIIPGSIEPGSIESDLALTLKTTQDDLKAAKNENMELNNKLHRVNMAYESRVKGLQGIIVALDTQMSANQNALSLLLSKAHGILSADMQIK